MKVENIVKQVAKMLAKEDLVEYLSNGTSADISQAKQDKQQIVDCLNNVLGELSVSLVKLNAEQTFTVVDDKIFYADFSKRILRIKHITDLNGKSVKYQSFPSYIRLYNAQTVIVEYNYLAETVEYEGEITVGNPAVTEQILSCGTIAEYCLNVALYSEAVTWRKKYEDLLGMALYKQNYYLKGRAFV